jgi:putrescine aminotransferase
VLAGQFDTDYEDAMIVEGEIRPYRIEIPQADLDDLSARLERVRWSQEIPGAGWDYGVPVAAVEELVEHWRGHYDWRLWEARINQYPQFTTVIDGQKIHFLHIRSTGRNALPLVVTHGWPSSVAEFLDIIGPLTSPGDHGADPALAFDLVIPSLPGYAFSGPTTERGWDTRRVARAWSTLMHRLGYDRYGAVGNDWGAYVSVDLAREDPGSVAGVHVTQVWSFPSGEPGELEGLAADELAGLERFQWFRRTYSSYQDLQFQQPQTVAHALSDSPAGLLAWFSQIYRGLVTKDFVITNALCHWLTGTVASAMRMYYETGKSQPAEGPTTTPLGLAQFTDDFRSIRRFAERDHKNIISWNAYDRLGHFAAHQSPELLAGDIQGFFAQVLGNDLCWRRLSILKEEKSAIGRYSRSQRDRGHFMGQLFATLARNGSARSDTAFHEWKRLVTITPTPSLSLSASELEDLDRRHLIRSLQRGDVTDRVVIVQGEGCTVRDARGNEYLDASGGGVWHSPLGHGRKDLAAVAAAQMQELEFFTSLLEFSNDKAIKLAARLAGLAPEGINRVFFSSGGSEAVETAIKAARLYHNRRGEPDRTWIIARHYSFHGATYGSGTATGFPLMQIGVGPNLPNVEKVSPPYPYRAAELYGDEDPTDFLVRELEQTIERIGPGNIAAMIGEPVMAGGGVLTPPEDYWPRVRELLSAHGILLIADEVVTAFGRMGAWFDSAQRGMAPDMITTAKGIAGGYIPLGATLMTDAIADELLGVDDGFFHGYTFQGHPVACALGLATIDIIEREGLLANALSIGDWLRTGLAPAAEFPTVGDIRVEGSLAAVELVSDKETRIPMGWPEVTAVAFEIRRAHHVIARPYAHNLVLAPPLVFTEQQARQATTAVLEVLSRLDPSGQINPR